MKRDRERMINIDRKLILMAEMDSAESNYPGAIL